MTDEPAPQIDPSMLLSALRARFHAFTVAATERELRLVDEIAHLEAYATQLAARVAELEARPADAWGDTTA